MQKRPPAEAAASAAPLTLEIFRHALTGIADEMSVALRRAAYSTNIKTRLDFSCSLLDGRARTIAQSFTQPIHLGTIARFVPAHRRGLRRSADLRPGDAIICNDSHLGGLHLNDVCLVAPLIVDGEPFAYAVSMAHHVDIGGGTPGSIGLWREQIQEGLIIPPLRVMREGVVDETFLRLLRSNVRSPRETEGDLRAQLAAVTIGLRRLAEMIEQRGAADVRAGIEDLLDYTHRRTVASLATLPKGTIEQVDYLDDDGMTDEPVRVAVAMTVDDEPGRVRPDRARRPAAVLDQRHERRGALGVRLRAALPDRPRHPGQRRLLPGDRRADAAGHDLRPAAARRRSAAGADAVGRLCETALRAFASILPERAAADSKGSMMNISFGGVNPRTGEHFVYYETQAGGYGGRDGIDGLDARPAAHPEHRERADRGDRGELPGPLPAVRAPARLRGSRALARRPGPAARLRVRGAGHLLDHDRTGPVRAAGAAGRRTGALEPLHPRPGRRRRAPPVQVHRRPARRRVCSASRRPGAADSARSRSAIPRRSGRTWRSGRISAARAREVYGVDDRGMSGYRVAIDIGGTFTDVVLIDDAHRRALDRQGAVDAGRPERGLLPGARRRARRGRRRRSPSCRPGAPRDDGRDERGHHPHRRPGRADRDRGLPRRPRDRPPDPPRPVRPAHDQARAARAAASGRSRSASGSATTARCTSRSTRTRSGASAGAIREAGDPLGRRLPAPRLPQPGPRGARRGDPARGDAGRRRLALEPDRARDPRVPARQHDRRERLRRPDRRGATSPRSRTGLRERGATRGPVADEVQRRDRDRRGAPLERPVEIIESGPAAGLAAAGHYAALVGSARRGQPGHGRHDREGRA